MSTDCGREHETGPRHSRPRRTPQLLTRRAAVVVGLTALLLVGCANQDESGSSTSREVDYKRVEPADFALLAKRTSTFILNVHTPDEGSIPGTDAAIPYNELQRRAGELPDRSTVIAVYCRTGRMSTEAVPTLRELGFTRIIELSGGMEAWQADGRQLSTKR